MHKIIQNLFKKQVKINGDVYPYDIGEFGVSIRYPDGSFKTVRRDIIKGHYDRKGFQKILNRGGNWQVKSKEIKKYIEDNL